MDLADLGYRPVGAPDGARGLALAQQRRPDAVVLDLLMPSMDGFEFLRHFRRIEGCTDVPVIVWTVKDLSADERSRLRQAAQAIVAKGIDEGIAPLLDELQRLLPRGLAASDATAGHS